MRVNRLRLLKAGPGYLYWMFTFFDIILQTLKYIYYKYYDKIIFINNVYSWFSRLGNMFSFQMKKKVVRRSPERQ